MSAAAVQAALRHVQIVACAGSGKTETLAHRVAGLVAAGAAPESIVAFTFTERAATELKDRIARRVAERMGTGFLGRLSPLFVGTIHSYCFRLLQMHVPKYGNFDVLDEHRHAGLLSREYRRLGLEKLRRRKHWQPIRDFSRTVDIIANELIQPARLEGAPLGECYAAYRAMLDQFHFLTFGQIIALAVHHLEADAAVFARVHGPLRHLFVDEYQDINPAQERLIELLGRPPVQVCVVGDDDQSIYQWRGADIRNILGFRRRYAGVETIELDTNRRSRPKIIDTANTFARTITPRLDKAMTKHRPPADPEVVAWKAETPEEEAERIAETIERLHAKGFGWRDIAVLFRSVRTSAPPLVTALQKRRIPFTCGGRTGLFLQPEVALFGEIHAWFADGEWKDERYGEARAVDLDRIVAGLEHCFHDGQPIPGLKRFLEDWRKDRLAGTKPISLVGDFYKLLRFLKAHERGLDDPVEAARFGALARFSQVLADFEHITRRGRYVIEAGKRVFRGGRDRGKDYARQLYNYLLHYARDAYEEFEGESIGGEDAVDLLTIHQSKGLEWPVVFVPSLVEGRFPSRRAGQAQDWLFSEDVFPPEARNRYQGSEAEERRLFYVALTRARDCVYLSHFDRMARAFVPSRFFTEVCGRDIRPGATLPLPAPGADTPPREPPPLSVTFSDVALFEDCGHRYRLAAVFGFQQELAVELGYGKALHHILRQLGEAARTTGRTLSDEDLARLISDEFYLPFANAPTFERMTTSARRLIDRYLTDYAADLQRIWDTERPFELPLDAGVLAGRADVILNAPAGGNRALSIVDYKVSADLEREQHNHLQLAVYAAAGRGEGLEVEAAYLHDLRHGKRIAVDVSENTAHQAVQRVGAGIKAIRDGAFTAHPTATRCATCDFRRVCPHASPTPEALL